MNYVALLRYEPYQNLRSFILFSDETFSFVAFSLTLNAGDASYEYVRMEKNREIKFIIIPKMESFDISIFPGGYEVHLPQAKYYHSYDGEIIFFSLIFFRI